MCVCVFFVFGSVSRPPPLLLLPRVLRRTHSYTYFSHRTLSHTTLSHTTLSHTIFVTHHLSRTILSHTTLSPIIFDTRHLSRPTLSHTTFPTQLCHTPSLWQAWHLAISDIDQHSFCVVGVALWHWAGSGGALGARWSPGVLRHFVALGDIHLHFAWQVRRLWHWAGSGGALGAHWSPRAPRPAICVAGEALGDTHLHLAWRGMWRQPPTFCAAGVALMALGCFAWQAWHLATSTYVFPGRRGTCSHQPSFCLAGVELGDIHAASEPISLKYDFPHIFVSGFLFVVLYPVRSFRPSVRSSRPPPLFLTQLCHTPTLSHTIFHTQLCHTTLSHTTLHIQLLSYRSSASTISFVLSAFSLLLQPLFVIIGRI